MSSMTNKVETRGQICEPADLLQILEGLSTDQKKYNHLRNIFLEDLDVIEYIEFLDTDENLDLTRRQLTQLKSTLEGYKAYLKEYLERTGERIGRFDEMLKKNSEEYANPDLTPEKVDTLARTRKRISQAIKLAKTPRGTKGKSLMEVTQRGPFSVLEVKKELSPEKREELLKTVKVRFEANMNRHQGIEWLKVEAKLKASPKKMWSLNEMESTGGEPDIVGFDKETGEYIFNDCSVESPQGRRMICYDREAQEDVEKNGYKTEGNALDIATSMGIEVLTEAEYRELQKLGVFDRNTFSWLKTPFYIRKTDYALNGRHNYCAVVVGQGRAGYCGSYNAFRGKLRV